MDGWMTGWVQQVEPKLWLTSLSTVSKWAQLFSFQSSLYMRLWSQQTWLAALYVNMGAVSMCVWALDNVCLDIFLTIRKILKAEVLHNMLRRGIILRRLSLNVRADESLVKREAAATSLLQMTGGVHSCCTFNTSCVDQEALMSTLRDLLL